MKKYLALCMCIFLVLSLCACGGGDATGDPDAKFVGVAMPNKAFQRWNQDGANMKRALEEKGYRVELQYAENDVNTQVSQIENMITKQVDILVIAAIDGSALSDVLKQAKANDIKVIAYDRLIMNSENVDYYATFDNEKVGKLQGEFLIEKLKLNEDVGPYNIEFFAGSPDDNNAVYFYKGAIETLRPYIDAGKLKVPSGQTDFAKVAINSWKSEQAQARMDNLLTAHYASGNKLDAILASNDTLAIGILASLKNIGYNGKDKPFPIITGQDCDRPNVVAIKNGEQAMSVFKDTRTLADKVVGMVDALLSGKEAEVNDTQTYDNGAKIVPTYLCSPVIVIVDNYKETLVDSGYYSEAEISK